MFIYRFGKLEGRRRRRKKKDELRVEMRKRKLN